MIQRVSFIVSRMQLKVTYDNVARTLAVRTGILLIIAGFALIIGCAAGALQFSTFEVAGHSGVRSLAGLAVLAVCWLL